MSTNNNLKDMNLCLKLGVIVIISYFKLAKRDTMKTHFVRKEYD